MIYRIVVFVGFFFSEEWKYYCLFGSVIELFGSWRNVLLGKFYISCVVLDFMFEVELFEISFELKVIFGYCDVLLLR